MNEIIFLIKSSTVDLKRYTIKDVQASSKRLDVIARCIISALIDKDKFHVNHEALVFLDKYGGFKFDPKKLNYNTFPKNELLVCDYFVKLIRGEDKEKNPLKQVETLSKGPVETIQALIKDGYEAFVLSEKGEPFKARLNDISKNEKLLFIVGSQTGEFVSSDAIKELCLTNISLGKKSYLASQVIRLIKIKLRG